MNGFLKKLAVAFSSLCLSVAGALPLVPPSLAQGSSGKTLSLNRSVKEAIKSTDNESDFNCVYFPRMSEVLDFTNVSIPSYDSDTKAKVIGCPSVLAPSLDSSIYYDVNFGVLGSTLLSVSGIPSSVAKSENINITGMGGLFYSPQFVCYGGDKYISYYRLVSKGLPISTINFSSSSLSSSVFCSYDDSGKLTTISTTERLEIKISFRLDEAISSVSIANNSCYFLPFITFGNFSYSSLPVFLRVLQDSFLAGVRREQVQSNYSYQEGFSDGEVSGKQKWYNQGYEAGKAAADKDSFIQGYNAGYSDGSYTFTPASTIFSLFGAIASVPTEILNGMADLSIWNVSILSVIFTLLFLALVLWVIRKFI